MRISVLRNKLAYKFDNTLTKGIGSLIWWLALTTIIIVSIISILVWYLDLATDNSFFDQFWFFLLRSIGDDYYVKTPWGYRILYLIIVFSSIFITSILISILTQIIQSRVEELRKGHSKIIEKNHTVILGWSSKIYTIIEEFDVSAIDEKINKVVVVMGNEDKVFMEDEILRNVKNLKRTKVICRTGDATNKEHLDILNLKDTEAIIILAESDNKPDTDIIKTLLSIKGYMLKNESELQDIFERTITEINDEKNKKIADIITNNKTKLIRIKEFTAKIIAQTARQSGLPKVYEELFDFNGMEIYFIKNEVDKINYKTLLTYYKNISVIGYMDENKKYYLNPDNNTIIQKGYILIVIAESEKKANDRIKSDFVSKKNKMKGVKNDITTNEILILGWNDIGNTVIRELASYVKGGNKQKVTIVPKEDVSEILVSDIENNKLELTIKSESDYFDYKYLNDILNAKLFKSIIILSDKQLEIQESDVKNITILHFIRDIEKQIRLLNETYSIDVVCQLRDEKNQNLISDFHKNDFVISAKLASLFFSQISQNFDLFCVFDEILDETGSEIYLKEATNYFDVDEKVTYADIIEEVSLRNETVIGFESSKTEETNLNIEKNKSIIIKNTDRIILLEKTEFEDDNNRNCNS